MSKEAMKLALEAIEAHNNGDWDTASELFDEALPALQEALAEQPAQQEPVGKIVDCDFVGNSIARFERHLPFGTLLYTSPPAQPQPLTERELMKCITQAKCFETVKMTYESGPYEIDRPTLKAFEFARAIEAAHGIKENT